MKRVLFTTVLLAASYAFAADPSPEGTWNVASRACSSNAAINDGVKIGQDKLSITQKADNTFEYKTNIGGCETVVTGTYKIDGMMATYTALSQKGCKDAAPVPMNETHTVFFAHLSETEAVTVTTGAKAAMVCPAGDALIVRYTKEGAQTPPTPTP